MDTLGRQLGRALDGGAVVYLSGELGTGKTALVRGVLHGLGFTGSVRSPTYTLVEGYEWSGRRFQHLDLYRIIAPVELEFLGIRELDDPTQWVFVEWPERGAGALPRADVVVNLEFADCGRRVSLAAATRRGRALLRRWRTAMEAKISPLWPPRGETTSEVSH